MKFFYWISIAFISFISCRPALQSSTVTGKERLAIDNSIQPDEDAVRMINPYKTKLDAQMDRVLTYNPYDLSKEGLNSKLGILAADAMLEEANLLNQKLYGEKVHIALTNHGGLRRSFSPGNLTVRSVFELMPFENEVVVLKLSGEDVKKMIYFLKNSKKRHPIAGISLALNGDDSNVLIHQQAFDISKTYNVVTTDYLQGGGDGMDFFKNPIEMHLLNLKLRDLFIQNFQKSDTLKLNETPRYR